MGTAGLDDSIFVIAVWVTGLGDVGGVTEPSATGHGEYYSQVNESQEGLMGGLKTRLSRSSGALMIAPTSESATQRGPRSPKDRRITKTGGGICPKIAMCLTILEAIDKDGQMDVIACAERATSIAAVTVA